MSISMCENEGVPSVITMWRARGGVGDPFGQRQPVARVDAVEQLLGARLLEGHRALAHGVEPGGVVVDPDHPQPAVGERQRQRQPDAAEADHGDVGGRFEGGHRGQEVSDAGRRCALAAALAQVLTRETGHEPGVVAGVAPPQAAGLAVQPVGPLQAVALHPRRRLGDEAGVEVEGGADADEQRRGQPGSHARHPQLLLGLSDADPNHRGARSRRSRAITLRPPRRGERAEGRRVAADDPQAGEALAQAPFEQLQRLWSRPPYR